jgi:hypothetical protein
VNGALGPEVCQADRQGHGERRCILWRARLGLPVWTRTHQGSAVPSVASLARARRRRTCTRGIRCSTNQVRSCARCALPGSIGPPAHRRRHSRMHADGQGTGHQGHGCTELKARSRPKVCLQVHTAHLSPAGGLAWPISTCCSLQAHHCALACSACVQATIAWPTGARRPQPAPEPVVPVVRFERDQLATRLHEPLQVTHLDLHATHGRHVACRHRECHGSSMAEATAECEPLRGVLSQASNTRGGMDRSGSTLRNRIQSHWVLPRKVSKVKRNHHSVAVRSNAKGPNNTSWAVHSREQGDAHMAEALACESPGSRYSRTRRRRGTE